jgi:hypothetical protein
MDPQTWWGLVEEDGTFAIYPYALMGAGDNLALYQDEEECDQAIECGGIFEGCRKVKCTVQIEEGG